MEELEETRPRTTKNIFVSKANSPAKSYIKVPVNHRRLV